MKIHGDDGASDDVLAKLDDGSLNFRELRHAR